jgi:hypothetical protein
MALYAVVMSNELQRVYIYAAAGYFKILRNLGKP